MALLTDETAPAARGALLPYVFGPSELGASDAATLQTWLADQNSDCRRLLLAHGALLLRGFEVNGATDFDAVVRSFQAAPASYVAGNSPRTKLSDRVYTSTEYPADQRITLHNELSYAKSWPELLLFHCETPAAEGGRTPILDGRALLAALPPDLVSRFRSKGLRYVQNLHAGYGIGRSWQAAFETTHRDDVEAFLVAEGVDFEWGRDGGLQVRYPRTATSRHPVTDDEVWFNQADQWHPSNIDPVTLEAMLTMMKPDSFPHNVTFGDGEQIPAEDLQVIRETAWREAARFDWRSSDVLIIDNVLIAHGREPFRGSRRVLVAMA